MVTERNRPTVLEAIDEIERCADTHFDPVIVEAFLPIARELAGQAQG
jgi:response regulator RpfG family c-di-GMP phosphodiesterase